MTRIIRELAKMLEIIRDDDLDNESEYWTMRKQDEKRILKLQHKRMEA